VHNEGREVSAVATDEESADRRWELFLGIVTVGVLIAALAVTEISLPRRLGGAALEGGDVLCLADRQVERHLDALPRIGIQPHPAAQLLGQAQHLRQAQA
jgi:hypothetical protein